MSALFFSCIIECPSQCMIDYFVFTWGLFCNSYIINNNLTPKSVIGICIFIRLSPHDAVRHPTTSCSVWMDLYCLSVISCVQHFFSLGVLLTYRFLCRAAEVSWLLLKCSPHVKYSHRPTVVNSIDEPALSVCVHNLRMCRVDHDVLWWCKTGSNDWFPKSSGRSRRCSADQVEFAICPVKIPWCPVVRYAVYLRITQSHVRKTGLATRQ